MHSATESATLRVASPVASATRAVSRRISRTGIILTVIPVLFLVWDTVIKLMVITPVRDGLTRLGYPISAAIGIGIAELACLILYLIPRTAIFGAVLFTGYLGGAVATHVRVGDPVFTHILFPIYVAALLWGGLFLRDARLRSVLRPD